jgi:hypothetical protein
MTDKPIEVEPVPADAPDPLTEPERPLSDDDAGTADDDED